MVDFETRGATEEIVRRRAYWQKFIQVPSVLTMAKFTYCKIQYNELGGYQGEPTMARSTLRKDHPLSMRLPDADIAIIDRAASLRGRSRTEFMRDAAVRTAEEVIMENTVIRMSPEGFAAFVDLLDRPAKPVPEMVELLKRPAPWETKAAANSQTTCSFRTRTAERSARSLTVFMRQAVARQLAADPRAIEPKEGIYGGHGGP